MGSCVTKPTNQTPNRPNPSLSTPIVQPQNAPVNPPRICSSCRKAKPTEVEVEYTNLGDGRYLCPDCLSISVMEPTQLGPIIHQVHCFFYDHLKLLVKKDIPIFFIDANEIRRFFSHEMIRETWMICGLTLSGGSNEIKIVKGYVSTETNIEAVTETKTVNGDKVAAILLLFGFPKHVVGSTLAHEMMRAWIWLQGWSFTLEESVEESICDVVASMWLDYTADENDPSYTENNARFAKRLSRYHRHLIETASSGGAKFLKAKRAVEKYGLEDTLMHLAQARCIPE